MRASSVASRLGSMRVNLPTDLLRSFVTIVETGSMVRASDHIHLTQSALSLQMKRLADLVQRPIFRRRQGTLSLTPEGEQLLVAARAMLALNDDIVGVLGVKTLAPIRIGMIQDFAEAVLSGVLRRFNRSNPDLRIEVRIGTSAELREVFDAGMLDIVLYLGDPEDAAAVATAPMAWLGEADLLLKPVLPIALMEKPCRFRDAALSALAISERDYSVAIETPSVAVLRAAVESGLAVTCRTNLYAGPTISLLDIGTPQLPVVGYNMAVRAEPTLAMVDLVELIGASLVKLSSG